MTEREVPSQVPEAQTDKPKVSFTEQLFTDVVPEEAKTQNPTHVSVKDLANATGEVLTQIRDRKRATVVTYRGLPSFLVLPLGESAVIGLLASRNSEEFARADEIGTKDLREGKDVVPEIPQFDDEDLSTTEEVLRSVTDTPSATEK